MSSRHVVTGSALIGALAWACASEKPNLHAESNVASGARPGASSSADDAQRRALTHDARERLGQLESEMTRVASRLRYEGTAEQRAAWDEEINDVEHDRKLLLEQLREAELGDTETWRDEHARLAPMVDVLIIAGKETAAQIDRALDADRAAARVRSAEPAD